MIGKAILNNNTNYKQRKYRLPPIEAGLTPQLLTLFVVAKNNITTNYIESHGNDLKVKNK